MFRPQIQKTRILFILALFSVILVYMVSNSKTYINNFNIDKKYLAVDIMTESINLIKEDKPISKEDIYKTIPKAKKKYMKVKLNYNGPVQAPIKKDDIIGKLKIIYKDELINEFDLLAFENVKRLNVFSRLIRSFNFLIWGDV